ncbi:radical SAM family heme chaperone HemW [Congregibacter litoralis]|uniref:Heme chaperone HemW n=1 Tax=Congregibacter litoralis KT71 TaxID=314285 RepID=A4A9C9_9GAMM|nr:radical SAM family heme chaperone HemW [Congregibacter litoralis]EAQ97671.1 putative oxygen-independent coproporphyrinogen III oxidase [Congregibacter litoralis KT71]
MEAPQLGLYVHLPWCERKCPYCDFNSHEASVIPEAAYIDTLILDLQAEINDQRREIDTMFIGGGTPSLFSVDAIGRLMEAVKSAGLAKGAEVTMEANPGSVEAGRLKGYAEAGVTRFSLGIQSFSNGALQALGRIHDGEMARRAAAAAQGSGAASYNIDLMHGLPAQTLGEGLNDIRTALALSPPHLSWYQLTIEPNTRFYSQPPRLPEDSILGSLEEEGCRVLQSAGYHRYEVSAWARPGEECQHNLNYWRFGDYLAIGAGAHGKLSTAQGEVFRYAKTRQPDDYLAAGGRERRNLRTLDSADRQGEFMLNALRLAKGFSLTLFEARTGLDADRVRPTIDELADLGLLTRDGEQVRTTDLGRRFLDDVVAAFFPDSPDFPDAPEGEQSTTEKD